MAWTNPASHVWTTGETVTAANMNTYIRLNLQETAPAVVTTAGDLVYADGANSLARLAVGTAGYALMSTGSAPVWREIDGATGDSTYTGQAGGAGDDTPTTFTDLDDDGWGAGTSVAVTATTGTKVLVSLAVQEMRNPTAGAVVDLSYRVSGATTDAAGSVRQIRYESGAANDRAGFGRSYFQTGLTAGSNTFTLQARAANTSDAAVILRPHLIVQAL